VPYEATKALDRGKGVLYLYGNYAGDNMNFDIAAEMAAADGIRVETVRICDDVTSAPPERMLERRGIAGDLYMIKATCGAASVYDSLDEVARVAKKARDNIRSLGVALSAVCWTGWSGVHAQAKLCDSPKQMDGFKTCANIEKAEAEGAFVLYSTDPEQGQVKLLAAFNKVFPKIKTSYVRLQAGALYAKVLSERQANVQAAGTPADSRVGLAKNFKNMRQEFRFDSLTRVGHRKLSNSIFLSQLDRYRAAGRCELHCIIQQIPNNLFHAQGIAINENQFVRHFNFDFETLRLGFVANSLDSVVNSLSERNNLAVKRKLAEL
jgi:hypothetical protein